MFNKAIYYDSYLPFSIENYRKQIKFTFKSFQWAYRLNLSSSIKRVLDIIFSVSLLLALSPIYTIIFTIFYRKIAFLSTPKIGFLGKTFNQNTLSFSNTKAINLFKSLGLDKLPLLINVLKGDMTLVGPRAISIKEMDFSQEMVRRRTSVKPGLVCLWWVRQQTNINYSSEVFADLEYIEKTSFKKDIGILLRALLSSFYGTQPIVNKSKKVNILNFSINNFSMDEAVQTIVDLLKKPTSTQISFINADCVNRAYKNAEYFKVLQNSDICLADGIGMKIAGKLLNQPIKQNVNGTDMFPYLCEKLSISGHKIFFLGALPGVAKEVENWVKKNFPTLVIAGSYHGYFNPEEEIEVIKKIADSKADILLVAMGAPKQEEWIAKHLPKTKVKVAMGVGGLFDFYSARIPRAPIWLRELGLEWLYRFYQEPERMWHRYFVGNFTFMFRVFLAKLNF